MEGMPCVGFFGGRILLVRGNDACEREREREREEQLRRWVDGLLGIEVYLEILRCNIDTSNVQKEITLRFP